MPGLAAASPSKRTIRDIKEEILRRARERQTLIERGEYDVPLHYAPLPLAQLLDLLGQLEYRRDALGLAVPPPAPGLAERLKRGLKSAVCKVFRWLLIRQVEYNSAAVSCARETSELLGRIDRNQNEFTAALTALKLQVHALAQRLGQLESLPESAGEAASLARGEAADRGEAFQIYLQYLRTRGTVLVLGCPQGELVKLLLSEGVTVQGVDADTKVVDYCRERDLPVIQAEPVDYLRQREVDSIGAIYVGLDKQAPPPSAIAELLGLAWSRLRKDGWLIAEAANPVAFPSAPALSPTVEGGTGGERVPLRSHSLPAELLTYLVESQCFSVADVLLTTPARAAMAPSARITSGEPLSLKHYRHYAIIGRK